MEYDIVDSEEQVKKCITGNFNGFKASDRCVSGSAVSVDCDDSSIPCDVCFEMSSDRSNRYKKVTDVYLQAFYGIKVELDGQTIRPFEEARLRNMREISARASSKSISACGKCRSQFKKYIITRRSIERRFQPFQGYIATIIMNFRPTSWPPSPRPDLARETVHSNVFFCVQKLRAHKDVLLRLLAFRARVVLLRRKAGGWLSGLSFLRGVFGIGTAVSSYIASNFHKVRLCPKPAAAA